MEKDKLVELIESKTPESDWLDFKQKWHSDNVELLRDILSFINTAHHKDCYLIFGIEDKSYDIIGVNNDDNRKDTQKLIDFLSSKELSTETPKVIVESFIIKDKEIDVLTIFDTKRLPVFLKSNYKKRQKSIYPGQIFTRIGDTNTPINTTANDPALEKLYRKRLRLDITIYERYDYLIERVNDWTYIDEEQKLLYNFDPNFYILIVPCEEEEENRLYHTGDYYSWLVDSSSFPSECESVTLN